MVTGKLCSCEEPYRAETRGVGAGSRILEGGFRGVVKRARFRHRSFCKTYEYYFIHGTNIRKPLWPQRTFESKMPRKRALEFDPNKSDSEDEDFDVTVQRGNRTKVIRSNQKPRRKRRRVNRRDSGDDDNEDEDEDIDSDDDDESEASFAAEDETKDALQTDPRTGRPMRKSKSRPVYEESDGDSIDFMNDINEMNDLDTEVPTKMTKAVGKKSVVIKLKYPPGRVNRSKSHSIGSRGATSETTAPARRSSRIAHDEDDNLYELTNSGNHVAVTGRDRTKSPEMLNLRPTRGGKGLKKPTILDIAEETISQTREEAEGEGEAGFGEDRQQAEIPASREDAGEADMTVEQGKFYHICIQNVQLIRQSR